MLQLLRECPPGFGGVERVTHTIASELGGIVLCLRRPGLSRDGDPLPVSYSRRWLPAFPLGRLLLPLPTAQLIQLLFSGQPLLAHLPCPTVLLLVVLARFLRPRRTIRVYWHAFLAPQPGLHGWLLALYQELALLSLQRFSVITTSPPLRHHLQRCGLAAQHLTVLPCSLPPTSEAAYRSIQAQRQRNATGPAGTLIAIGRLDSYKRFDWLIAAMAQVPAVQRLDLLGDGPQRSALEALADRLLSPSQKVIFHGRVDEIRKQQLLAAADVLLLPADRCNEAFGIVQLEAMASGIPALAFRLPRSGMHWVSELTAFPWSGQPADLAAALQGLLSNAPLWRRACIESHQRYNNLFATSVWRGQCQALLSPPADA